MNGQLWYGLCEFCGESPVFESRIDRNRWEQSHPLECHVVVGV